MSAYDPFDRRVHSGVLRLDHDVAPLLCLLVQPLLARIVNRIAFRHPSLFERLERHRASDYIIDPVEFPFALHLCPDPAAPVFRAVPRDRLPPADAMIRGKFGVLLKLLDADEDGDSVFFSRALSITGDTEAVVCLRNALDDMEGSVADEAAGLFGPPGRAVLAHLRRRAVRSARGRDRP